MFVRVLFLVVALAGAAPAHVVFDRSTLRQFVVHSDATLWVEFVSPLSTWAAPGAADRQDFYRVRPLETISGEARSGEFDFFPHAEGLPAFRQGDRALVFLEATSSRDEFAPLVDRFPVFSVQGAGDEWFARSADDPVLSVARRYARWRADPSLDSAAALRAVLLEQLESTSPALQDDALAELVRARESSGFFAKPEDVAAFGALTTSQNLSFAQRLGLVRLLESQPGFDLPSHWRAVLESASSPDETRLLIQLAGGVEDQEVAGWLAGQLASPDAGLRRAAARALRQPWHASRVPDLVAALSDADPAVARASIQSLGAIGTPDARGALREFAANGESEERRRWASAALRRGAPAAGSVPESAQPDPHP